jgi:hypothetical protein
MNNIPIFLHLLGPLNALPSLKKIEKIWIYIR